MGFLFYTITMEYIEYVDFEKVIMRLGTIIEVLDFPEARKPAYKLHIDFGEAGTKWSSSQITDLYSKDSLIGKQVFAVCNLSPKQVGPFISECLTLGIYDAEGRVILATVDKQAENGSRLM